MISPESKKLSFDSITNENSKSDNNVENLLDDCNKQLRILALSLQKDIHFSYLKLLPLRSFFSLILYIE